MSPSPRRTFSKQTDQRKRSFIKCGPLEKAGPKLVISFTNEDADEVVGSNDEEEGGSTLDKEKKYSASTLNSKVLSNPYQILPCSPFGGV